VAWIVSFTDARARLTELLDDVEARHEHVVITRKGLPAAVVVPVDEWQAIGETLDVLRDKQTLADLRESAKDVKADRLTASFEPRSGAPKLHLTRRARDQLGALPKATQDAVLGTLLLIQREPETIGNRLVALAWPRMAGLWGVRAGSYRVLYTIERRGVIIRAIRHGGVLPREI
jgi:prevent-host-death family protein